MFFCTLHSFIHSFTWEKGTGWLLKRSKQQIHVCTESPSCTEPTVGERISPPPHNWTHKQNNSNMYNANDFVHLTSSIHMWHVSCLTGSVFLSVRERGPKLWPWWFAFSVTIRQTTSIIDEREGRGLLVGFGGEWRWRWRWKWEWGWEWEWEWEWNERDAHRLLQYVRSSSLWI